MAFALTEIGNTSWWVIPRWLQAGFGHGFGTRHFPVVKDLENRSWEFTKPRPQTLNSLHLLYQVHSSEFLRPQDASMKMPEADGWLVDLSTPSNPNSYGITTADCTPVIIFAQQARMSCVLHCGWRGATAGLFTKALQSLFDRGVFIEDIEVAFGPAAKACCYEVGEEVAEKFLAAASIESGVIVRREGRCYGNVHAVLHAQAKAASIPSAAIYQHSSCTICDENFFSYRREKPLSGHQVSFICAGRCTELS